MGDINSVEPGDIVYVVAEWSEYTVRDLANIAAAMDRWVCLLSGSNQPEKVFVPITDVILRDGKISFAQPRALLWFNTSNDALQHLLTEARSERTYAVERHDALARLVNSVNSGTPAREHRRVNIPSGSAPTGNPALENAAQLTGIDPPSEPEQPPPTS